MPVGRERVDVVVVGAGHAGVEAAVAAARLGCQTTVVTPDGGDIGYMPCNPAIGGTAKGHLVREIDALGGVMGEAIDATGIQFKLLNRARGAAVWSPRAQADKSLYSLWVTDRILAAGVTLVRDRVASVDVDASGVCGVYLEGGGRILASSVVVTTGTFLAGVTHVGDRIRREGRYAEAPSDRLAECIRGLRFAVGRLKTGTPPRLARASIDFDDAVCTGLFEEERGDDDPVPFSFMTRSGLRNQVRCWSLYTNRDLHTLVRSNIGKSPLYNGTIKGIGPRYCPSLEDKVMRFPDRERHQVHLEPEGIQSESIYVNGLSMSLPAEVQEAVVRSLPGLADAKMLRPGYAVEYDFVQPTGLSHALESRSVPGLFLAGQVNGTSGYEEAAAQGLVAGINAARRARLLPPTTFDRQGSYIGILIDDLVSHGCLEPYRMFTSRAEHRLLLRIDNADLRLTTVGREIGLVSDERWASFEARRAGLERDRRRLRSAIVVVDGHRMSAAKALKRPEIDIAALLGSGLDMSFDGGPSGLGARSLESEIKYEGYIRQERAEVHRLRRIGRQQIPKGMAFDAIPGISREVAQRLAERLPESVAQAAGIPGMTPAALAILSAYIGRATSESPTRMV